MLRLTSDSYEVTITNDQDYILGGHHAKVSYEREYIFGDTAYLMSQHAVICRDASNTSHSCILLGDGGMSGVHAHSSILHQDQCLVAVGRHLVALRLPDFALAWSVVVDTATCFGVYFSPKYDCFISHGECEIARVTKAGEIVWWSSGKDIFTNGFTLHADTIEVIDFNEERYQIEIATGTSTLVSGNNRSHGKSSGWLETLKRRVRRRKPE